MACLLSRIFTSILMSGSSNLLPVSERLGLGKYQIFRYGRRFEFSDIKIDVKILPKRQAIITAIILNWTYLVRLYHSNITSDVLEEFIRYLKKYIASNKYLDYWRLSVILDNATS